MNRNYGKLENNSITYAPNALELADRVILNPTAEQYLAQGYKAVSTASPTDPAPTGYHYETDGWEETDTTITRKWKTVADAPVYRKFSKWKIYCAIVSIPDSNGTSAWDTIKAWLEAKTINGINGWTAFTLVQEISEDNQLFAPLAEEARRLLGLTTEQFETLLNACILEE